MNKKVIVTYQVSYETEIEVDTELLKGTYFIEDNTCISYDAEEEIDNLDELVENVIDSNEIDTITPLEDEKNFYRENSFEITSFEIV